MLYEETIVLKDGRRCVLRNGTEADARAALDNFILTHGETDFLSSYPEDIRTTAEQEAQFLKAKAESADEIELLALVDGLVVGTAGIDRINEKRKEKHRAEFGISIARDHWGLGIGRALMRACVECAVRAGYRQLELDVVADNERAIALYESEGFAEYGRNPRGFLSPANGWQTLVLMRRELGT